MADNHIIVAGYAAGGYTKTRPAFQYDYGQELQLQGFPEGMLPASFEMHFSIGMGQAITRIGTNGAVAVPNVCLERFGTVTAWLYLHDSETDGETKYVIEIPVRSRAKTTDQEPTPAEQSVITEAIAALNAGVTAAEAAQGAAETAQGKAEEAQGAAETAQGKAEEAQGAAEAAANSVRNAAATAETLAPGSDATVTVRDVSGVKTFEFGIPAGVQGETGNGIQSAVLNNDYTLTITYTDGTSYTTPSIRGAKGDTGATPAMSIGTVTTGAAGSSAAATMTGTPEAPVLNLTIPRGDPGNATIDDTAGEGDTTKVWSADKNERERQSLLSALYEREAYARKTFTHTNGTAHSSNLDKVSINLESGKTYIFRYLDTAGNIYVQVFGNSTRVKEVAYPGIKYEFTPSANYETASVYVSAECPTGTLTFEVYEKGYVLDSNIDSIQSKIDAITDDLYGASVFIPSLRNGTYLNAGNANAVCTISDTPVQVGDIVEITVNRELPAGHVYLIGYSVDRSSGAVVTVNGSETTGKYITAVMPANATYIHFNIGELDGPGGATVVLRAFDFEAGDIVIKIHPRSGSIIDTVNKLQSSGSAVEELIVAPVISNGSGGNPGNVNSVTARAVPIKGAYAIRFINNHPLAAEGNYYKYDFSAFRGSNWYTNLITEITENPYVFHASDIIKGRTDVDNFGVTIWEYDSSNNYVSLRTTDFQPGEVVIQYIYQLEEDANNIVNRNEDMRLAVYSSSNYGHNGQNKANVEKVLSMLAVADIHYYANLLSNASEYLNAIPSIDCGIVLGDIMAGNYAESDGTWYTNIINNSDKIIYTLIGNHDGGNSKTGSISGSKQDVFNKFILPVREKMGMASLTKTYYSVNFSQYKIMLIVLDNYDAPDTKSGSDYVVSRGAEVLSQEQVNWFISTLNDVPSDYTVVVARHSSTGATWIIENCSWTKDGSLMGRSEEVYEELPVNDIIHAWQTGSALSKNYEPIATGLSTITVNCDFSSRGVGKFACYLFGHSHCDTVAYDQYGNLGVQFDTASSGNSQPGNSDLPRVNGIKSEDCLTVVGIDTYRSLLKLVRIGSNVSMNMVNRSYIALPFQKSLT